MQKLHGSLPGTLPRALEARHERPGEFLASDVTRHVLDNGLTVLVKEVYPASVVSLSIWTRVGSLDETEAQAGLSHFLEHMLFKGTPRRPVGRIAQEIHSLGGYLNGFTSYDCTCYWIVVPSRCFATALDIEVDAMLHPLLDPAEIARESHVIVEELRMYEDRPDAFCFQQLMGQAFREHRYRRPIIGFEDVVLRTTAADLEAHYRRYYRPDNMAVVVVGDVRTDAAIAEIAKALGHLAPGHPERDPSPVEPPQQGLRRCDLEGDVTTSRLQMGFHVPSVFEADTFACDILSSILGEGRSSRLYLALRERLGLVNSVGCSLFAEGDPGLFVVTANLETASLVPAEEAILAEVGRVAREGIRDRELQKAKNMVEAAYVFAQETVEGQGKKLGYYEMLGDHTLAERYVENLYRVTAEDVARAAAQYIVPGNCSVVTYRPRGSALVREAS